MQELGVKQVGKKPFSREGGSGPHRPSHWIHHWTILNKHDELKQENEDLFVCLVGRESRSHFAIYLHFRFCVNRRQKS